ncbi:hypothetical protein [Ruegeria arenilitoris]|uniref:hypothetical protein n=1 Tax=Ruegeria arenilitoris TaxID=1173585 RepID=UPI0014811BEA|nr:hypothetical protein [Ruegeria arenilitoris]
MGNRTIEYKLENDEQLNGFISNVLEDLEFIESTWTEQPTRTIARVYASILRRLIVDRMYEATWTFLGMPEEPSISAVDLDASIASVDSKFIHYAYAGGAPTKPASHCSYALFVVPGAGLSEMQKKEKIKELTSQLSPSKRSFPISEFYASSSVMTGSVRVSREGIIRYVANKLGGVHWDNRRGKWIEPIGGRHRFLDEQHMYVGPLSAPLYEIVSISYALISSEATKQLMDAAKRRLPLETRAWDEISFREGRAGKYAQMNYGKKD